MHTGTLARSPHLSWLGFGLWVPFDGMPLRVCRLAKSYGISVVLKGRRFARWIHRGHEVKWTATTGAVHFAPADHEYQTCVMKSDARCDLYTFWIPQDQLDSWASSEDVHGPVEWKRIAVEDDPVLQLCMNRLARDAMSGWGTHDLRDDEAARRLFFRLAQLHGGKTPDWQRDTSVFGRRMLNEIVASIDEHLRPAPSLSDMASLINMSPGHFAKKFHRSTGLSFHRFINYRRILKALVMLQDASSQIARVAHDLGFTSQGHITRLFGARTGMTPAKHRKQFIPVVG